jgi:hypothetical protein
MGLFVGRHKIEGNELQECVAYLKEEWKFKAFQGKVADIFNEALTKYDKLVLKDTEAANEMQKAAERLIESAEEIMRRREKIISVPKLAIAVYSTWQEAYSLYLEFTRAQWLTITLLPKGIISGSQRLRNLFTQFQLSKNKAIAQEKKFIHLLGLNADDVKKLFDNAYATILSENW